MPTSLYQAGPRWSHEVVPNSTSADPARRLRCQHAIIVPAATVVVMRTVRVAAAARRGPAAHSPRRAPAEDGRAAHMKGLDRVDGGPGDGLAGCHLIYLLV